MKDRNNGNIDRETERKLKEMKGRSVENRNKKKIEQGREREITTDM